MAETPNPYSQAFFAQAVGSDAYQKLLAAQQQQALAQALLQQGETPISTEGRSIGGVGYRISPLEGVAKLAQVLSGRQGLQSSNQALANALAPQQASAASGTAGDNPSGQLGSIPQNGQSFGGLGGLNLPPGAALNMDEALKSSFNNYYADHRPGAVYRDPRTGQLINAPTDLQLNTGTGGVANAQPQQQPMPQINPMSGGPMAAGAQTQAPPMQQAPSQNSPPPPSPAAFSGIPAMNGLPSSGQPMPTVAPMNMGTIAPIPGESAINAQNRAEVAKQNAINQNAVQTSGAKTQAEDTGKNLADVTKTYNVADANLPRAFQRFNELRQASKIASSGGGVSDQEPPNDPGILDHLLPGPDYARSFARSWPMQLIDPQKAVANQTLETATKQGVLSELGPQLAGMKPNKLLDSLATGAAGLNVADPDPARQNAINSLQDQYISNLKAAANQRTSYGDQTVPNDLVLAQKIAQNAEPTYEVHIVHPDGTLGTVKARSIIQAVQSGSKIQ